MQTATAVLRLTRPGSTVLAFLSVFLPVAVRTGNVAESFAVALPMLFISMCTYIVNDIDDVETDRVNHPDRPLPSGHLLLPFVTAIYFVNLALALFTTRTFVSGKASFLYYALLLLAVNYTYVANYLTNLKSSYVAGACSLPILITIDLIPHAGALYVVAPAVFFFVLGRELLLDYLDQPGDPHSFINKMSWGTLTTTAFASQGTGLILLSLLARKRLDVLTLCLLATLFSLSLFVWLKGGQPRRATLIMKFQMYGGLYFLLQS